MQSFTSIDKSNKRKAKFKFSPLRNELIYQTGPRRTMKNLKNQSRLP